MSTRHCWRSSSEAWIADLAPQRWITITYLCKHLKPERELKDFIRVQKRPHNHGMSRKNPADIAAEAKLGGNVTGPFMCTGQT